MGQQLVPLWGVPWADWSVSVLAQQSALLTDSQLEMPWVALSVNPSEPQWAEQKDAMLEL